MGAQEGILNALKLTSRTSSLHWPPSLTHRSRYCTLIPTREYFPMRSLTKPLTWFLLIGFLHMPAKDGSASYPDSLGFLKKLKNELKRLYSLEHQAFLLHLGAFHASKSGEVYLMFRLDSNKVSYIMSEISRHSSQRCWRATSSRAPSSQKRSPALTSPWNVPCAPPKVSLLS